MNLQVVTELVRSIKSSSASLHRLTEISPSPFPRAMLSRSKCAFCLRVPPSVFFSFPLSSPLSLPSPASRKSFIARIGFGVKCCHFLTARALDEKRRKILLMSRRRRERERGNSGIPGVRSAQLAQSSRRVERPSGNISLRCLSPARFHFFIMSLIKLEFPEKLQFSWSRETLNLQACEGQNL